MKQDDVHVITKNYTNTGTSEFQILLTYAPTVALPRLLSKISLSSFVIMALAIWSLAD